VAVGVRFGIVINGRDATNDNELKLAAIMGTAIHAEIEKAISALDPKGEKYLVETEVAFGDMKAHIDLYIPETGDVIDWKTVKVKNLSYFPSLQQRWQVQVYGYLLDKSGKGKPRTVNLVAIARDGDERDIKVHSVNLMTQSLAQDALELVMQLSKRAQLHQSRSAIRTTADSIASTLMSRARLDVLV
jgi:hypothetical protein